MTEESKDVEPGYPALIGLLIFGVVFRLTILLLKPIGVIISFFTAPKVENRLGERIHDNVMKLVVEEVVIMWIEDHEEIHHLTETEK